LFYRIINLLFLGFSFWLVCSNSLKFAPEIDVRRERGRSLLLLYPMNTEVQIQMFEKMVADLISAEPELFLVEVKIKPTNNIKVYIDGNQGISIEKLVQYNRRLYKKLEEENIFPNGDFSLEVSSPGLDEPLKLHRQYLKNIDRFVEVIDNEGVKKEGKLISVSENEIVLEEIKGKGKKMETLKYNIPFGDIKTTKIQIKF
jgi:ribosome maturation factor RimP